MPFNTSYSNYILPKGYAFVNLFKLKNSIENILKHYVPEVESVEAVDRDTA
jgi:hypothetical protein